MAGQATILTAGSVVIVVGIGNAAIQGQPLSKPALAGVGLLVLASLFAALGEGPAKVAAALVVLAAVAVSLNELPGIVNHFNQTQQPTAALAQNGQTAKLFGKG